MYETVHACEGATQGQGTAHPKGFEETMLELKTVSAFNSHSGKPHNSCGIGGGVRRLLT